MTEIIIPTRAKRGYIETTRVDKGGRTVKAKDHLFVSAGMHSTKEMEQVMIKVAKDVGASENQIRVESFNKGEALIEANPRHRGYGTRWERSTTERQVGQAKESYQRKAWGGWSAPGK